MAGVADDVLRAIEKALPKVEFHVRGNQITASGPADEVDIATQLLDELLTVLRSGTRYRRFDPAFGRDAATGCRSHAFAVVTAGILSNRGRSIRPETLNQKHYVDAIDRIRSFSAIGPAGTGKT